MFTVTLKKVLIATLVAGALPIGAVANNRVGNGKSIEPHETQKPNTCTNRVGNGSPRA